MRKVTPEKEQAAHDAGRAAAELGKDCVPAQCLTYCGLITGFQVGDGAAHLAWRWMEGWHQRMAEMPKATA